MEKHPPLILGLLAPSVVCVIVLVVMGRERGWLVGGITAGGLFAVSALMLIHRVRKHPDDWWKAGR